MRVDFSKTLGAVKPMHATNNGPFARANDIKTWTFHPWASNLLEFKNAGIPYARMHDSSFYHRYGQEHTVDVYYLFPNLTPTRIILTTTILLVPTSTLIVANSLA